MLDPEDINQIESLREVGNDKKADALLEEKLAEIKPKAEEVLKKLQDGADFDTLMKEHSQDPGLEAYPDGYLIVPNSTRWVESFYKTSISLEKVGDISGLVNSDYGYHIIQYAADRTLTDEDKKEGMEMAKSIALNQKRSEETSKLMNSWDERFKMEIDYEKLDLKKPEETTSK
jgi:parvulin-like peptidyl-prolyl isomerase